MEQAPVNESSSHTPHTRGGFRGTFVFLLGMAYQLTGSGLRVFEYGVGEEKKRRRKGERDKPTTRCANTAMPPVNAYANATPILLLIPSRFPSLPSHDRNHGAPQCRKKHCKYANKPPQPAMVALRARTSLLQSGVVCGRGKKSGKGHADDSEK
ncbi:hypothetical protein LY78DRAFT_60391 [Colletotrichum sublineola]|nr:hypothetical protein LY78DRAFT_60391 [Colletotrichum sublineola]